MWICKDSMLLIHLYAGFLYPGISAEDLVSREDPDSPSSLNQLQTELAALLDTQEEFVDIFNVRDVPQNESTVDVFFSASGSPYYRPARLNGIVWTNRDQVE